MSPFERCTRNIRWKGALCLCLGVGALSIACRKGEDGGGGARSEATAAQGVAAARGEVPPELGRLEPFSLTSQVGKEVTFRTFEGEIWAAAFMFTRCPTVCPEITRRMKGVQDEAKQKGVPLKLVSFSMDPEHDTPEVLARYAADYGADLTSWFFLTGPHEAIARAAEHGFKVGVAGRADPTKEHMGITHGSHLVLVDGRGTIRGYYRTSEEAELKRLLEDAARL